MNSRTELKTFGWMAGVLAAFYFIPLGTPRFDGAVWMRRVCGLLVLGGAAWMIHTAR